MLRFLFSAIFFPLRRLQSQGTSHFSTTPAPLAAVGREVVDVVAARRLAALAFDHVDGPTVGATRGTAAVLQVILELLEDLRRLGCLVTRFSGLTDYPNAICLCRLKEC